MRRRPLLLVGFLMCLFMVPLGFVSAIEYDTHAQSITSFEETLPDNVMHYPDSLFSPDEIQLSDYGEISDESYSANHVNTHAVDATPFTESSATDIEIWFTFTMGGEDGNDGFFYSQYLKTDGGDAFLGIWNYSAGSFDDQGHGITTDGSYAWFNGSATDPNYWNGTTVGFQFADEVSSCTLDWDYGEVRSIGINALADYGEISDESYSADYVNTHVLDGVPFTEASATDIEIWIPFTMANGGGYSYSHYLKASSTTNYLGVWNFNTGYFDVQSHTIDTTYVWCNGVITDSDYWNGTHVGFQLNVDTGVKTLYWDYGQVASLEMTYSVDNFAESFAVLDEWTFDVATGVYSFSSYKDIGILTGTCVGTGNDYVRYEQYGLNIPVDSYVEVRLKTTDAYLRIQFFDGDIETPTPVYNIHPADYTTYKFYLAPYVDAPVTGIELQIDDFSNTKENGSIFAYFDYLRIGPADEMGFQHDMSNAVGITNTTNVTASSNGDTMTFTGIGGAENIYIECDITSTQAAINTAYYPFLEFSVTSLQDNNDDNEVYRLYAFDSAGTNDSITGWLDDTGTFRYNVEALPSISDISRFMLVVDAGDTVTFNYTKLYSIADYTITQSGVGTDTICYVDSSTGELVYDSDTDVTSFILFHDPVISVDRSTYSFFNISTSTGLDLTGENDFNFYDEGGYTYLDTVFDEWDILTGTMTDFHLTFYTNVTIRISNILFLKFSPQWWEINVAVLLFDTPEWNVINSAALQILTKLLTYTLGGVLILIGIVMIPCSTIFLVHGGTENLSKDKVFLFLIAFFIGWGLFLGGIM